MGNPHRGVGSFNPSWCFRPPPAAKDAGKRSPMAMDVGVGSVANSTLRPKSGRRLCRSKFSIPTSPKISCMGQIKSDATQHRRASPPTSSSTSSSSSSSSSFSSSKSTSSSRREIKLLQFTRDLLRRKSNCPQQSSSEVELKDGRGTAASTAAGGIGVGDAAAPKNIDPPLPVLHRRTRVGEDGSLWGRRCGEVGLTGLDLEHQRLQGVTLYRVVVA